jgi:hypothetical protein
MKYKSTKIEGVFIPLHLHHKFFYEETVKFRLLQCILFRIRMYLTEKAIQVNTNAT